MLSLNFNNHFLLNKLITKRKRKMCKEVQDVNVDTLDSHSAHGQEYIDKGIGVCAVSGSYGRNMNVGVYTIMPSSVCSVIAMLISD
jgi:hypothetical protein